ncbi:MAG: hypothetical protein WCX13_00095 [Candidatus Hydrogenedentales bacterium]
MQYLDLSASNLFLIAQVRGGKMQQLSGVNRYRRLKGFSHPWLEVLEWSGRHSTIKLNGGFLFCRQKEPAGGQAYLNIPQEHFYKGF